MNGPSGRCREVPDAGWLAALASLPGAGPARLSAVLTAWSPIDAWHAVGSRPREVGRVIGSVDVAGTWQAAARAIEPAELIGELRAAGIGCLDTASPAYPASLRDDDPPPPVLFVDGDPRVLAGRTAAIVGTRTCTRYGIDVAHELGATLAAAGVTVVSGLAAGIDAAAHSGALSVSGAPPAAVVAGGLDHRYPRQNASLWQAVAAAGAVVSEAPLGVRPERWRFPARNRIIAGLSEVVVVVESHDRGGSLYTAAAAIERDIPVMAVPGPIRSGASSGCNRLLADGCHPLCAIAEVLELLDLVAAPADAGLAVVEPSVDQQRVLDAIGWQPTTLDEIVVACGGDLGAVSDVLESLVTVGLVVRRGRWFERTARPSRHEDPVGP